MYKATVKVPGSCGELVQGIIDKKNFLITCPIDLYSRVTVKLSKDFAGYKVNVRADKAVMAVKKILNYLGRVDLGVRIYIDSQLIPGKGMASSTADITGVTAATMIALDYEVDLQLIKRVALEIEPTDGIFLPGVNLVDHLKGEIEEYLGEPPRIDILIFSERGQVDTISFNQRKDLARLNAYKENLVREAVDLVKTGMQVKDRELIGWGATLSSLAHQWVLHKSHLDRLIRVTEGITGIYGVNVAHSGTLMGLLIEPNLSGNELIALIKDEIPGITYLTRVHLISGGIKVIEGD